MPTLSYWTAIIVTSNKTSTDHVKVPSQIYDHFDEAINFLDSLSAGFSLHSGTPILTQWLSDIAVIGTGRDYNATTQTELTFELHAQSPPKFNDRRRDCEPAA